MPASEWGGVNVALGTQIATSDESRSALRELIPSTRVVEHPLAKPGTSIRTTMPTPAPPARAPVSGTVSPSVSARGMVPVASHSVAVQAEGARVVHGQVEVHRGTRDALRGRGSRGQEYRGAGGKSEVQVPVQGGREVAVEGPRVVLADGVVPDSGCGEASPEEPQGPPRRGAEEGQGDLELVDSVGGGTQIARAEPPVARKPRVVGEAGVEGGG